MERIAGFHRVSKSCETMLRLLRVSRRLHPVLLHPSDPTPSSGCTVYRGPAERTHCVAHCEEQALVKVHALVCWINPHCCVAPTGVTVRSTPGSTASWILRKHVCSTLGGGRGVHCRRHYGQCVRSQPHRCWNSAPFCSLLLPLL